MKYNTDFNGDYHLEFRPYQLPFSKPLTTNHGSWSVREGIIIRLTKESGKSGESSGSGRVSYGEIAPIPWFGSETIDEALQFCQQLPARITQEEIWAIPDRFPAAQFGFSCAWENLESPLSKSQNPFPEDKSCYSYLLPTGVAALDSWQTPWQQGYRTFKWKIGVEDFHQELDQFQQLVNLLPVGAKLRLDANGGLNLAQAKLWLGECDRCGDRLLQKNPESNLEPNHQLAKIEFLEQPLPVENFGDLLDLANNYSTKIALDESVATLGQLKTCYAQGWRGIFVIKPSITGYSDRLREFFHHHSIDAVFSSSLETAIGRDHALRLGQELSNCDRALGFGVDHWLNISSETLIQQLWQGH